MKRIRVVMFMLLTCIIMTLGPLNVFAVSDIDNDRSKSLTVYFYVQKLGIDKPIEGANIGITKIADIEVKNENIEYSVVEKYKELSNTKFDGITVDESKMIAKKFNDIVDSEFTGITNSAGTYRFEGLESGVYLVKQLAAEGESEEFVKFDPYIILVPYADNYLTEWNYDILSEPKTVNIIAEQSSKPSGETDGEISTISSDPSEPDESHLDESSDIGEQSWSAESEVSDSSWRQSDDSSVLTGDTARNLVIALLGVICLSLFIVIATNKRGVDRDA